MSLVDVAPQFPCRRDVLNVNFASVILEESFPAKQTSRQFCVTVILSQEFLHTAHL